MAYSASDTQSLAAVRTGTIDMMGVSTAPIASVVPELGVFDLPFLFANEKEADTLLDGKVGDWFNAKMPAVGLVNLGLVGERLPPRDQLQAADQQAGRLRRHQDARDAEQGVPRHLQHPGHQRGADGLSEVYSALETKAVDGQENPYLNIENMKFYEVQKYLSLTKHSYSPTLVLVSKKIWDTLTPQEQGVLKECAAVGRDAQRKVNREKMDGSLAFLKAQGMVVNEISPAEMARIRERTKPIYESTAKTIGPEALNQVQDELKRIRGQ